MSSNKSDSFLVGMGGVFLAVAVIFFIVIFHTLVGGCAAWVVGLVFGDTILRIAAQVGIHDVTMFQLGCFLGFVGGYFKTSVTSK